MKIIENKKIFGKINVIDILIILVAIVLVILAYLYFGKNVTQASTGKTYTFQYEMQNILKQTADSIKVGDKIYDNETNAYIGEVVNVEILPYKQVIQDNQTNEFVTMEVPDRYLALITMQNTLIDTGNDLQTSDEYIVKVGKRVYIRGGIYAGSGYIVYIERQEEQ